MHEENPLLHREQLSQLQTAAEKTALFACAGTALASGAYAGAAITNKHFPAHVELAPGLGVDASIESGQGLVVPFDPIVETTLPSVPIDNPGPWDAVRLDPTSTDTLNIQNNPDWAETYLGIFTNYDSAVREPIESAIKERLLLGGGLGAATVAGIGAAAVAFIRMKRSKQTAETERDELRQKYEPTVLAQEESAGKLTADERKTRWQHRWNKVRKPLAACAMMGVFISGCANIYSKSEAAEKLPANATYLPSDVQELHPFLEDGYASGPLQGLPRTIADVLNEKKKKVDRSLADATGNFVNAHWDFTTKNEEYISLRDNPNIKSLLHVSDLHCNRAVADTTYRAAIRHIQPDIIMNTGDTQTNSGTTPLEEDCFNMFLGADRNIPMINVNGNHDKKQSVEGTMTLNEDSDYHAEVDGIDFVGIHDPEDTKWSATRQEDKDELQEKAVELSKKLADKACEVEEETGVKPVALAHRWQVLSESILRGCVSIANNGHLHSEGGIRAYRSQDGLATVLQHTNGSSSGIAENIPFYDSFAHDAYMMEQLYNTVTQEFVGFVTYRFKTDGNVEITFEDAPTSDDSAEPVQFAEYIEEFDGIEDPADLTASK